MAEQWMSIVEYARAYNVSDMTVRRRIKTGRLHAVLKDGKYFIPVPLADTRPASVERPSAERHHRPAEPEWRDHTRQVLMPEAGVPAGSHHGFTHHPHAAPATPERTHPRPMATPAVRPKTHHVSPPVPPSTPMPHAYGLGSASVDSDDDDSQGAIPQSLRRPMLSQDVTLVETRALLAFCEASLRKINDSERKTIDRFKAKLDALESTLALRDNEINQLKQQLEDLQLLVKILEGKK